MIKKLLLIVIVVAGAACSSGPDPVRYGAVDVMATGSVHIRYGSVALRDVSLPDYATEDAILLGLPDGGLQEIGDGLWADDPVRAVSLGLAANLAQITKRQIAPEPWPFNSDPEATLDIRLQTFVPRATGQFVVKGLYFVSPFAIEGPERSGRIDIVVPFDPSGGYPAISRARAQAVSQMALEVAQSGLR